MAIHVRCFEVTGPAGTLYATLQYGELEPGRYGPRVRLSRRGARAHGEVALGFAQLNTAAELVRVPPEAGVTDQERAELEQQIKTALS